LKSAGPGTSTTPFGCTDGSLPSHRLAISIRMLYLVSHESAISGQISQIADALKGRHQLHCEYVGTLCGEREHGASAANLKTVGDKRLQFQQKTLAEVPPFWRELNGLTIDAKRLPSDHELESSRCAYAAASEAFFMRLKVSSYEQRDGFEGYFLLVFGRDPIVINGWRQALIQETLITQRYELGVIERAVKQAAAALSFDPAAFHFEPLQRSSKAQSPAAFEQECARKLFTYSLPTQEHCSKGPSVLQPKRNTLQRLGHLLHNVVEGVAGALYTKRLAVEIVRSACTNGHFIVRFVNRGFLGLRDIQVAKEDMVNLMSPGLKTAMNSRHAGFSYSEWPAEDELLDGVSIDRIDGKRAAEVEWPAVTFYKPVSRKLFVRYEIRAVIWRPRFVRYVYAATNVCAPLVSGSVA